MQPSQWSQLTVRLWGLAASDGADSQTGGTGNAARPVVTAHGAPLGVAAWDGAGLQARGMGSRAQLVIVGLGVLVGDGSP